MTDVDKLALLKGLVEDNDPFIKLTDKMSEMQIEMMQHNWSDEERIEKARVFRLDLFKAIGDYRDWWIARYHTPTTAEDTYYNEMAEAEDEAKALEEEIEEENKSYYESIINPDRV